MPLLLSFTMIKMSKNFETFTENTLSNSVVFDNPTFTNSALSGGTHEDFVNYFPQINSWDEDYVSTLNIGTPVSKNAPDQNDHFTFNLNFGTQKEMTKKPNENGFWKYEEDKTLKQVEEYLVGTYKSHYTSEQSKTQTLDLIESIGDAEAFTRSNAIKYLSRFGKKNGKSKMDILKAIHYCILLYHFAGLHKTNTTSDFPY